jgi:hypothetical protein
MNKIIIALIGLVLIATPALACGEVGNPCSTYSKSDVRTSLYAAGDTSLMEYVDVAGTYGVHAIAPTAFVLQNVNNDGTLSFMSQDTNFGQWKLQEDSVLSTTGKTDVQKEVVWWTVDPTTVNDPVLKYPTVANIYTQFDSNTMTVIKEVENTADKPGTNYANPNVFTQSLTSTVPMSYMESVGINKPLRCDVLPPKTPVMPVCEGCVRE